MEGIMEADKSLNKIDPAGVNSGQEPEKEQTERQETQEQSEQKDIQQKQEKQSPHSEEDQAKIEDMTKRHIEWEKLIQSQREGYGNGAMLPSVGKVMRVFPKGQSVGAMLGMVKQIADDGKSVIMQLVNGSYYRFDLTDLQITKSAVVQLLIQKAKRRNVGEIWTQASGRRVTKKAQGKIVEVKGRKQELEQSKKGRVHAAVKNQQSLNFAKKETVKKEKEAKPVNRGSEISSHKVTGSSTEKTSAKVTTGINTHVGEVHHELNTSHLNPRQAADAKEIHEKLKNLPESELRTRLERLKKLPNNGGAAGITAINHILNRPQASSETKTEVQEKVTGVNKIDDTPKEQPKTEDHAKEIKSAKVKEAVKNKKAEIKGSNKPKDTSALSEAMMGNENAKKDTSKIKKEIQKSIKPKDISTKTKDKVKQSRKKGRFSKVDEYLDYRQEGKEFKDFNQRVAGSKKEMAAIKNLTLDNVAGLDSATAFRTVTKDRVFNEIDFNKMIEQGQMGGKVFFAKKLIESISVKPADSKDARNEFIKQTEELEKILSSDIKFQDLVSHIRSRYSNVIELEKLLYIAGYNYYDRNSVLQALNDFPDSVIPNKAIIKDLIDKKSTTKLIRKALEIGFCYDSKFDTDQGADYITKYRNIAERAKKGEIVNVCGSVLGERFFNLLNLQTDAAKTTYSDALMKCACSEQESENAYNAYFKKQKDRQDENRQMYGNLTENDRESQLRTRIQGSYLDRLKTLVKDKYPEEFEKLYSKYVIGEIKPKEEWLKSNPMFIPRENDYSFMDTEKKKKESLSEKAANGQIKWEKPSIHSFGQIEKVTRIGGKAISDKDIKTENIVKDWGYKSVQFGQSLNDADSRKSVKNYLEAMSDISDILNLDVKKINSEGGLSIAFAARGGGKASAHYEPDYKIINVTKSKGDGSVSHEWAHYLDHLIGDISSRAGFATHSKAKLEKVEEKLRSIMNKFNYTGITTFEVAIPNAKMSKTQERYIKRHTEKIDANIKESGIEETLKKYIQENTSRYSTGIFTDWDNVKAVMKYISTKVQMPVKIARDKGVSEFKSGANALDGEKSNGYWSKPLELFARAHEAYIQDKLEKHKRKNNYLVKNSKIDDGAEYWCAQAYPQGEERVLFNQLFDEFYNEVRSVFGASKK